MVEATRRVHLRHRPVGGHPRREGRRPPGARARLEWGHVIAQVSVTAVATVAGAALARWRPGRQEVWFGAAAGALLVIAGLHLLPDAWHGARAAGLWPWAVPAVAVCSFVIASVVARFGC